MFCMRCDEQTDREGVLVERDAQLTAQLVRTVCVLILLSSASWSTVHGMW
jgi:hypothetical protein